MKKILVTGSGGFIGSHLTRRLKRQGHWVRGVDIKHPRWSNSLADEFWLLDLREQRSADMAVQSIDRVFHLAADMGGAGFVFTGKNDLDIALNNTQINSNMVRAAVAYGVKRLLFSSSACMYPEYRQMEGPIDLKEEDAYPAQPDTVYGWEKLWMERMCLTARKAGKLDVRIVRFHNCFGPEGEWKGGREKAPAAICRKVATAKLTDDPKIEIWGDGEQVRSFMYIDDCIEGVVRLMDSDFFVKPLNLGRDRAVTINYLVDVIAEIAEIEIEKVHIPGPVGVRYRNSDNSLCKKILGWAPTTPLEAGLIPTYEWIERMVKDELRR